MSNMLTLDTYRLLGRSGLRVSPLALGTMTFGTDWGWGANEREARRIFDSYVDRGGNFIDTANQYTNGTSERFVGEFAADRRERLVIATKYTLTTRPGDPNSGGNHRRSMVRSVEGSLGRLKTDYIDLLYLHAWDFTTPVEKVLRAMDDLRARGQGALRGNLRYTGLAGLTHAGGRRSARLVAADRATGPIQSDRTHGGARAHPHGARHGARCHTVVAARHGRADGQVQQV
jgi:aryl-alcohol dehydrogenase-like predicted oxidoreductase